MYKHRHVIEHNMQGLNINFVWKMSERTESDHLKLTKMTSVQMPTQHHHDRAIVCEERGGIFGISWRPGFRQRGYILDCDDLQRNLRALPHALARRLPAPRAPTSKVKAGTRSTEPSQSGPSPDGRALTHKAKSSSKRRWRRGCASAS